MTDAGQFQQQPDERVHMGPAHRTDQEGVPVLRLERPQRNFYVTLSGMDLVAHRYIDRVLQRLSRNAGNDSARSGRRSFEATAADSYRSTTATPMSAEAPTTTSKEEGAAPRRERRQRHRRR